MTSVKSKIIFFGFYKSFDYYKIGGLESFYRRLTNNLIKNNQKVSFLFYGDSENYMVNINENISIYYINDFYESLDFLKANGSLVIDNYLLKKHRLTYSRFRIANTQRLKFGHIYTGIPKGIFGVLGNLIEYNFPKYNGPVLSPSYTINKKLRRIGVKTKIMPPPIPLRYSLKKEPKNLKMLKVTFVGRFDVNKGIMEVIQLFKLLSNSNINVDLTVSGYFAHGICSRQQIEKSFRDIKELNVIEKEWSKWSQEMENDLIELLQQTDILVLPYKNLKGTMDPPLLVLEGMACGCVIITTDVGSVKEFYGESDFILKHNNLSSKAFTLIQNIAFDKNILINERARVVKKIKSIQLDTELIINDLINV